MVIVKISPRAPNTQIEFPDKVKKRSVKGSLHFTPNSTKQITEEELKHIQENEKDFADHVFVVAKVDKPKEEKASEKSKANEGDQGSAAGTDEGKGETTQKKKRKG